VLEGLQAPNNSLKPTRLAGENAEAPGLPSTYRMGGASPSRRAAQLEAVRQLDSGGCSRKRSGVRSLGLRDVAPKEGGR